LRTLLVALIVALPAYGFAIYASVWPLQIQKSLAIIIIVIPFAIAWFAADRLIVKKSLAKQQPEEQAHEINLLLKTQRERLNLLSQELMRVQETERRRIARELHDDLGQNLTALSLTLQTVKASNPELASTMDNSIHTLERILKSVRNLSLD